MFKKLHILKKLDFYFFYFISSFVALLLIISEFISLFRKTKKLPLESFNTVSFFKYLGGGSLFILYPLVFSLKKKNPGIKTRLYCGKSVKVFAEAAGVFDEIVLIDSVSYIIWGLKKQFRREPELIMNLESNSLISSVIVALMLPKRSITFGNNHNKLMKLFYSDIIFYSPGKNIQNAYKSLFEFYEVSPLPSHKITDHFAEVVNRHANLTFMKDHYYSTLDNFVAIAPFSSELSKERELKFDEIKNVLFEKNEWFEGLEHDPDWKVIILGGGKDFPDAEMLKAHLHRANPKIEIINACGTIDLLQSVYLASKANLFFTIDSGLNHVVRLTNPQRILSFFGPTSPHLQLGNMPALKNELVVYSNFDCSPCVHLSDSSPCGGSAPCMRSLFDNKQLAKDESSKSYRFI